MKFASLAALTVVMASRPARALWIEIKKYLFCPSVVMVEAREGLVD